MLHLLEAENTPDWSPEVPAERSAGMSEIREGCKAGLRYNAVQKMFLLFG